MTKERVCANNHFMSRRTLLIALPASGAALTLPAAAQPDETEIMCLFRKHQEIMAAARVHVCAATGMDEDDELENLFFRHANRIEDDMMALPSTCAADMAAKMIVAHGSGDLSCVPWDDSVWIEARQITALPVSNTGKT